VPHRFSLKGMKIVVDCANGASYHIAPDVFEELGAEVIAIADQPDGVNINNDCGSTHPQSLQQRVVAEQADLGIAFDGDADRVLMVDDRGELVDGDQILFILAMDRAERDVLDGGVVGTLMSNFGLELALKDRQIPFMRAKVGDRYVMEMLDTHGWHLGGEASGHIVCLDQTSTGDGIISALQVLAALQRRNSSLRDACAQMAKVPQVLINVRGANRNGYESDAQVVAMMQAAESQLAGRGRVLLRPSGTEPLVRVMVEGEDAALVQRLCQEIAGAVESAIS